MCSLKRAFKPDRSVAFPQPEPKADASTTTIARIREERLGTPESDSSLAKITKKIVQWKHENGITEPAKTETQPTPPQQRDKLGFRYTDEIKDMPTKDFEGFEEFREVFERQYIDPERVLRDVVRSIGYDDWDGEMSEVMYNILRDTCLDAHSWRRQRSFQNRRMVG